MKIIFFGTPYFAAQNLQHLINNKCNIALVVTPPDRKKGRGKKPKPCTVKETALQNNLPVLQPNSLKDDEFIKKIKSLKADLFVVVAFRMLPKIIWRIPDKVTINLHTSLLPNYRGAAPINWVLINGENETGITTFFINEKIDCGNIIMQKKVSLSIDTTAAQLHNILIIRGGKYYWSQ